MKSVRLIGTSELSEGSGCEVVADGHIFAVFCSGGEYHVLDGICPHAGGPLGKGKLENGRVTCPWHGWQFDVSTGRNCISDRIVQAKYRVVVEGGEVFVELPE